MGAGSALVRIGHLSDQRGVAGGDDNLIARVRAGDDTAFAAIYDRYAQGVLAFCVHMLGNREWGEDALQLTFVSVYRGLRRGDADGYVSLRPWLYTIARNRCLSELRARREAVHIDGVVADRLSIGGPADLVQRREQLREMVEDIQRLPDDQRAALVLFELGDHSHAEIATVLGVRREKVKALIFQAREALLRDRQARDSPCAEIRERVTTMRGKILPRSITRAHIDRCPGCAAFEDAVRGQRRALALVLPVAGAAELKLTVLGSVAHGGGAAGGLATTGAGAASLGAAAGGPVAAIVSGVGNVGAECAITGAIAGSGSSAMVAKIATAVAIAVGVVGATHPIGRGLSGLPTPSAIASTAQPISASAPGSGASNGNASAKTPPAPSHTVTAGSSAGAAASSRRPATADLLGARPTAGTQMQTPISAAASTGPRPAASSTTIVPASGGTGSARAGRAGTGVGGSARAGRAATGAGGSAGTDSGVAGQSMTSAGAGTGAVGGSANPGTNVATTSVPTAHALSTHGGDATSGCDTTSGSGSDDSDAIGSCGSGSDDSDASNSGAAGGPGIATDCGATGAAPATATDASNPTTADTSTTAELTAPTSADSTAASSHATSGPASTSADVETAGSGRWHGIPQAQRLVRGAVYHRPRCVRR